MRKKSFTEEEQQGIAKCLSDAMARGLATGPVDKAAVESAVHNLYKAAGAKEPKLIIWMGSPLGGLYAKAALAELGSVDSQLISQLDSQLDSQLISQLDSQLDSQLYSQLGSQLRSQLESQLGSQLRSQLGSQLGSQLYSQLYSQLESQLSSQLGSQLYSQLDSQLWSQLESQLYSQLYSQLGSQLFSQLESQLYSQLYSQLESQLSSQLGSQLYSQLDSQLWSQLESQLRSQLYSQLHSQLWSQLWSQLDSQLHSQLWSQLYSQLDSQLHSQLWSQLYSQLSGTKLREQLKNTFLGQHDLAWLSFYSHARELGVTYSDEDNAKLDAVLAMADTGWFWLGEDIAVLTERPTSLRLDPNGRLHSSDTMAIEYSDGWGLYFWHGRAVDEWVITNPTIEAISKEENVEIRRCAIESMGWDKFVDAANLQLVDTDPDPGNPGQFIELYDVPTELWGDAVRLIIVTNGSQERDGTRRRYGLTVPIGAKTALEAVAWTVGEDAKSYAETARRT